MTRTFAALASAILLCALTAVAVGQTDDELREMYFRRDFVQMKEIARTGDARAEAWMGRIKQQEGERGKAKEWYRRAAEKNYPLAISTLAAMHRADGESERALYWYRRGAENGNRDDQATLARLLRNGTSGFPKDEREAFRWYSAAAEQRHEGSYLRLAEFHADGRGTERNAIKAYALAEIAETVLDPLSDGDLVATAKALKARLGKELQPDEVVQAARMAREIRPDLDTIRATRERGGYVLVMIVGVVLIAVIICVVAAVCDFVGLVRSGSRGARSNP